MKITKKLRWFLGLILLVLVLTSTVYSNEISKNMTLLEAIEQISRDFEVYFTFDKELVSGIKVNYNPKKNKNVEDAVSGILEGTALTYRFYNKRYMIIYKNDEEGLESLREMAEYLDKLIIEEKAVFERKRIPQLTNRLSAVLKNIKGKIVNEVGEALVGVNITVKGTSKGTVSDSEGNFVIENVDDDAILVFSYVGYQGVEIPIAGKSEIEITLRTDSQALSEVVVTAFGIERDKRSLTYATQNIDADGLAKAREFNVLNSLAGKVAGLNFQTSSSGVGGASRIVMRGNRSISGGSQPIYIVDGVPGNLTDISPDDIESITVLKGANAAALYGSQASNGAIVVTTKSALNTDGKFDVAISQSYTFDIPNILVEYQNTYGQGVNGEYVPQTPYNWGPVMDGQMVQHWSNDPNWSGSQEYKFEPQPNNVRDFYQTGHNAATNLIISTGNAKNRTYFSYTYTDGAGVVPLNDLSRHNVNLRLNNNLMDHLTLDARLSYMRQEIENSMTSSINFYNPNRHAYRLFRNIRTADAEIAQFYDENGIPVRHYWNPEAIVGTNPYTILKGVGASDTRDRIAAFATLKYAINDNLSAHIRSSLNRVVGSGDSKIQGGLSNAGYPTGYYGVESSEALSWNNDFLITYERDFHRDWSFNLNAGGNSLKERNSGLNINTGNALTIPNFYAISNTNLPIVGHNVGGPKDINSLYGFGQISYKKALFLDLTGRNDWSSTLPKDNWSFFYPSIGLNAIVTDLVNLPVWVSFLKLRSSLAVVGSGTSPFQLVRNASIGPGGNAGFLTIGNAIPNKELKPERTESLEIGLDLRLIKERIGLDLTYYKTNTTNQIFSIPLPPASGATGYFTNGGDVQNKGLEIMLNARPVVNPSFSWDFNINFSRNVSLVKEIDDERPTLVLGSSDLREIRIEQGKPWGLIYTRGFIRDENGNVVVGANGIPQYTPGKSVYLGVAEPDWLSGIQNTFRYKNFSLSFLVDVRQGGMIASYTNSVLAADGLTKETEVGRDGTLVFGESFFAHENAVKEDGSPNDIPINVQDFWIGSGGRTAQLVGEIHSSKASNMRLREVVLGYSLPRNVLGHPIDISLVGRNLFFFYNKAKYIDPDMLTGIGNGNQGDASFTPPSTRSIGFNLRINF